MPRQDRSKVPTLKEVSKRRYASSTQVAKLAGVSQSAVSRTFTNGASVSAKTRRKVLKAAEALGYEPNNLPRILQARRSSLIAIVTGGMYNPFYALVVEKLTREIQKRGSTVLLFSTDHDVYFDDAIPLILGYRVDGIISALSLISPKAAERCVKTNVPVVLFNGKVRNERVASICADNLGGGRDVAQLFLERGAKRFGFIGGKSGNLANEERMSGYIGHLAAKGITDVEIRYGNYVYEDGFKAAMEMLKKPKRPNAVFCGNDIMAIGALDVARSQLGLRVPQDVMIAGFDDIPAASWASIQLTTVRQDATKMVNESLKVLDQMIETEPFETSAPRVVHAPLIERQTTPPRSTTA
jgi:DNA-binding LacI/PurR family transcriptional regulator